jgi:hypothetical protein
LIVAEPPPLALELELGDAAEVLEPELLVLVLLLLEPPQAASVSDAAIANAIPLTRLTLMSFLHFHFEVWKECQQHHRKGC